MIRPRIANSQLRALRRHPVAAAILRSWRRLTTSGPRAGPGSSTLIACSGGADSSALAIALAAGAAPGISLAVAHIVHDLRPQEQALADRDAAMGLAARLGVQFVESRVSVSSERKIWRSGRHISSKGNPEAIARRLRYTELARLASDLGLAFVATGHQADDQVETVIMGLLRGAGPAGMAGVADARSIGDGAFETAVIRPMLGVSHAHAITLCRDAGVSWAEDETNADTSRLRAGVRHTVSPALYALRPTAALRMARTARLMRDIDGLISDLASSLIDVATVQPPDGPPEELTWPRDSLRPVRPVVLTSLFHRAARLIRDDIGRDRLNGRLIDPVVLAIKSECTDSKAYLWPGVNIQVTAHRVSMRRRDRSMNND
ncbi:MAG: tRNA lysidine(34) synthetase TilS [Phycisphaeraceae bacterium]|nr:tRNA lysidine(34) synthetase TilS [Phycisphaeraceae bacterium]